MPQCDADQCARESTGFVVLTRGSESREFRVCGPHIKLLDWYGHYGGLNTGDGMGRWRPPEEIYYYQIGDVNHAGDRAGYFGPATLSSTITHVQTIARRREWRIYATVSRDQVGQHAHPAVGEICTQSGLFLEPATPAAALWRRIEAAAKDDRGVRLSWQDTELLAVAGILSEIDKALEDLDGRQE